MKTGLEQLVKELETEEARSRQYWLDRARSLLAQEQEYLKHTSQSAVEGWRAIEQAKEAK